MASLAAKTHERLSVAAYEAFIAKRPDEERWELLGGVPSMMAPALIAHQIIAGNVDGLLRAALREHDSSRISVQRPGVDLGLNYPDYRPEPDVAVIDADIGGQRYALRCYLAVEVLSDSDRQQDREDDRAKIALKRSLYKEHAACRCVMVIDPMRFEVTVDDKAEQGWRETVLTDPAATLALPEFGLRCTVGTLYEGTPLRPRT